jgi:T5SS/PEP-CTERM-associated repeat protein/autotransporter-associated beta strand protein
MGSVGTVSVHGAGSNWTNSARLIVGNSGLATMIIQNGGSVSNTFASIGELADGIGVVTVDGAGSTWTNSSSLSVGLLGKGTLNITGGGKVTNVGSSIGSSPGSDGIVTVNGAGSEWINSGALDVGFAGAGTLNIENGGLVSAEALSGGNATSSVNFNGGILRIQSTSSSSNAIMFIGGGILDIPDATDTLTVTSNISGGGGLTKIGAGTLTLTGANAYNGDTRISNGALSISAAYLDNFADVYLSPSVTFGLNYSGTDAIDSLFIDGVSQALGTYGAIGSGADFEMMLFSGSGLLQVTSLGVPGDFNDDGAVDAADYVVWRKRDGTQASYDIWRANFGNVLGVGGSLSTPFDANSMAGIPEPASVVVLIIGCLAATTIKRCC